MYYLKTVVVEDEYRVRKVLLTLLQKYCPQVQVVAEADDLNTAYKQIIRHKPDVVFLDIEMPDGNGFDLLNRFDTRDFETIFVTSFGHYSIHAIRTGAFDYLLKPVLVNELQHAVERLQAKLAARIKDQQPADPAETDVLLLNHKTRLETIPVKDIVYLEADGNYTCIHTSDQRKHHMAHTLKYYEDLLCGKHTQFVRTHKAWLVNMDYVVSYQRGEHMALQLSTGTRIDVSRNRKQDVLSRLRYKNE